MSQPAIQPAALAGRLRSSLGVSLFLWLFALVLAAFAGYALWNARATERQWRQSVESDALRSSELIKKSTRYGMLLNRKEDVHQIIRTVAEAPGVLGVRVYDKQGVIIYSADAAEIGHRVDLQAEACVVCHDRDQPLRSVPSAERARIYTAPDGARVLGLINPIENAPACSESQCHAHAPEQTVLGVLDVKMSMAEADARLASGTRLSLSAALAMALLVGATSALFIERFVRRPVRALIRGTERIARGELDEGLEQELSTGGDELGRLAAAFERMTAELRQARAENDVWAGELERKVREKTEELSRTQRQVVHMEKMASLGKLAATVAHELNNPLAGILNYAKLVERDLREGADGPGERAEISRFLSLIQKESSRCGDIVRNLLLFARRSGGELALHALSEVLDRSLMIVRHRMELGDVALERRTLDGDDRVVCDAGQIEQALVALCVNAIEAMEPGGVLTLELRPGAESVEIVVADTGCGIAPEALPHVFEPFFTTKEGGSGAGLGLAVAYGIVERHAGRIEVSSEPGVGTTFRLTLPRKQESTP